MKEWSHGHECKREPLFTRDTIQNHADGFRREGQLVSLAPTVDTLAPKDCLPPETRCVGRFSR